MKSNLFNIYIATVALAGAASVLAALYDGRIGDPAGLLGYLALTLVASAIKARIPGIEGSVSLGFVGVLVGVATMSLCETVLVVTGAAVAQTLWRSGRPRPKAVQVIFNIGVLAASTWLSYTVAYALAPDSPGLRIAVAVTPLYLLNVGVVAGLLSVISTGSLDAIWQKFQFTVFPCYLVGALLSLAILQARALAPGWAIQLPMLGLSYLTFNTYRSWMRRLA